jgi:hypothetical protein
MPLVEHNDVIEAFPSNRPDDAFSEGVLPGRSRGDADLAHSQAFHPPDEQIAVDRVPVAEQVLGRGLFREALDKLVSGPGGGGVVGGVDMDEFSTVVSKDQESEEQLEGEGGHDEEVDSDDLADVCLQEGPPCRGWPRRGAPHVLGNGELGIAERRSSAWTRRRPQVGFSRAMRRIRARSSRSSGGRPTERRRDFQRQ